MSFLERREGRVRLLLVLGGGRGDFFLLDDGEEVDSFLKEMT